MSRSGNGNGARSRRASGQGSCRVLLLEDHADTRNLLRLVLRQRGHRVTEAETLADAERALAAAGAAFDVLIADLELPDGRAEPLIAEFKRRLPTAAVVVASAHAQPQDVRSARAHGADRFLVKPYTPDMLLGAIAQLTDCPPRDEVASEGQS